MQLNHAIIKKTNVRGQLMIKGIIFDMDGTILNTIDDITDSVNYALASMEYPLQTVHQVKMAVGSGAIQLIERVLPALSSKELVMKVFKIYQAHYDQNNSNKTGPYEGIMLLLNQLRTQGFKLSVVSNKYDHLVQELNEKIFNKYFDVSIGEIKGIPIKPAPDMIDKALKLLDLKKDEVLFVGDSEIDMLTATNAKLKSVGVTWGFRDQSVLEAHHADFIIHKPEELFNVIERMNRP
ncbi:MAG TPA: HAD family hydrolase [Acholeplasmataceae bacterium]|nr:HAD family hydrolase [Acholeplasmataceae bacterium]HBY66165.1 HAD family hydrolase [Acholeplasmataceae bacterium]HCB66049.1 HAD family hydrolase [Acholeplasmataceae bacterium]